MEAQRRCEICAGPLYGRADKRYCSATCRRNASRIRHRLVRLGAYEILGSEISPADAIEEFLIPRFVRQYGPGHVKVRDAHELAERLREQRMDELADVMRQLWADKGE